MYIYITTFGKFGKFDLGEWDVHSQKLIENVMKMRIMPVEKQCYADTQYCGYVMVITLCVELKNNIIFFVFGLKNIL